MSRIVLAAGIAGALVLGGVAAYDLAGRPNQEATETQKALRSAEEARRDKVDHATGAAVLAAGAAIQGGRAYLDAKREREARERAAAAEAAARPLPPPPPAAPEPERAAEPEKQRLRDRARQRVREITGQD